MLWELGSMSDLAAVGRPIMGDSPVHVSEPQLSSPRLGPIRPGRHPKPGPGANPGVKSWAADRWAATPSGPNWDDPPERIRPIAEYCLSIKARLLPLQDAKTDSLGFPRRRLLTEVAGGRWDPADRPAADRQHYLASPACALD